MLLRNLYKVFYFSRVTDLTYAKSAPEVDTMANECGEDMSVQLNHLLMLGHGTLKSKALFTACELGIFEVLSFETSTAKAISEKLSTNQVATAQLLDALVSLKVLEKHCEEEPPCYSNTQATHKFLVKSSPDSITGYLVHLNKVSKECDNLTLAVREGKHQRERTPGHTSNDSSMYNYMYSTEEDKIGFLDAMRATIKRDHALRCVSAFDLSEFNHMCDLGGKYSIYIYCITKDILYYAESSRSCECDQCRSRSSQKFD